MFTSKYLMAKNLLWFQIPLGDLFGTFHFGSQSVCVATIQSEVAGKKIHLSDSVNAHHQALRAQI